MSAPDIWTVGKLLTWTTDFLKQHGSQSPRLDAEVLLAQSRGCQRIDLYTAFDEEPSDEVKASFRELVRRRAEGAPVAYLVGHKEFYSLDFEVTEATLIPRPETEHLVVRALDLAAELHKTASRPLRVADIGTGSGCIAIAVVKHFAESEVVAVDVSVDALAVARRNAAQHGVDERIEFAESDLLAGLAGREPFDLILSNPPYVSEAEYQSLDATVRDFEPRSALVGGAEGFELISKLIEQSEPLLAPSGRILIEMSPMLVERQREFVPDQFSVEIVKDLANKPRILVLGR